MYDVSYNDSIDILRHLKQQKHNLHIDKISQLRHQLLITYNFLIWIARNKMLFKCLIKILSLNNNVWETSSGNNRLLLHAFVSISINILEWLFLRNVWNLKVICMAFLPLICQHHASRRKFSSDNNPSLNWFILLSVRNGSPRNYNTWMGFK